MSQRREAEIVVIGAGMWGLSVAYHLGSLGFGDEVLVIERNTGVSESVSPHAVAAIRTLQPSAILVRSAIYTRDLFENFATQTQHSAGFVRTGSIYTAIDEGHAAELDAMATTLSSSGVEVNAITSEVAQRLAPSFCFNESQAIYWVPSDGYIHLPTAGAAMAAASLDLGVRFATGLEAASLIVEERRLRAVKTSTRTVETSKVILTAGIWNTELGHSLGLHPPTARKRHSAILTDSVGLNDSHPIVHLLDRRLVVRAERGGYLCNFHEELECEESGDQVVSVVQESLRTVLPSYGTLKLVEQCGSPAVSVRDGLMIGPVPGVRGLWLATSGGDACTSFAGAVGRWLARNAVNGHPGDDISAYSLEANECVVQ